MRCLSWLGAAPEALAIYQNKLYVSNARTYSQNYAGSSVSVIDLESFETINETQTGLNPQYLRIRTLKTRKIHDS
jgi:hypothetical protein